MIATAFVASYSPRRISTDYQVGCRLQFLPSTEKVRVVRAHKSRARPSSLQDTTMSIRDEAFLPNVEEGTFDDDKLTGSEEDGMPKGIEPDYSEAQVDEMVEMYERGELEIVASDETKEDDTLVLPTQDTSSDESTDQSDIEETIGSTKRVAF
jgi:hypothetical protein